MSASSELAIRLARDNFNQALAAFDLEGIATVLAPDATLLTGTDIATIAGRKAQLLVWKREFAASGRTVYSRKPVMITVSQVEPIAHEQGHWRGISEQTGDTLASGIYSAKWRQIGTRWLIEAEIYVTLG